MSSTAAWNRVIIVFAFALLVFWFAVLMKSLLRADMSAKAMRAVAKVRAVLKMRKPHLVRASDTFARLMTDKITQRRLRNAGTVNQCIVIYLSLVLLYSAWAAFLGSRTYDLETMIVLDGTRVFVLCICLAQHVLPGSMNGRVLPICHSLFFMCLVLVAAFMAKNLEVEWYLMNSCMFGMRILLGLYYSTLAPSMFWNIIYTALTAIMLEGNPRVCIKQAGTSNFLKNEMMNSVLVIALTCAFEELQVSRVCSEIEAQSSSRSKETAQALLSAMCDAVVHLGPQLEILGPCPKFDALLFRQQISNEVECRSFTDSVHESDRIRFSDFVHSVVMPAHSLLSNENIPFSLHLYLRDVNGMQIPVQIFMVRCLDSSAMPCYIMGIKEDDELPHTSVPACSDSCLRMAELAADETFHQVKKSSDSTMESQSSSSSAFWECQANAKSDMWFVLDPFSNVIVQAASEFVAITGPSTIGVDLKDWISDADQLQRFSAFLQDLVNWQLGACSSLPSPALDFGKLKFRPFPGLRCSANWTLKVLPEDDGTVNVHVALSSFEIRTSRRSSHRSNNTDARHATSNGSTKLLVPL